MTGDRLSTSPHTDGQELRERPALAIINHFARTPVFPIGHANPAPRQEPPAFMGMTPPCRIALFSMDGGEYQHLIRDDCVQVAGRHEIPLRLFQAAGDAKKQVDDILACLREPADERPTVVIVCPVREISLLSAANAAARLGVGFVMLSRWCDYLNDLRAEFPDLPLFAVLADQLEVGRIQGRQIRALLEPGSALVNIRGPLGTSSAMGRAAGVQEILQDAGVKVHTLNADWTSAGGARAIRDWVRVYRRRELPKFVVAAQNDEMATGARGALEEAAKERNDISLASLRFCGCDGSPAHGQRLVTEGVLASTVVMPVGGGRAITEIASMRGGGPRPPALIALTPSSFPDPSRLRPLRDRAVTAP